MSSNRSRWRVLLALALVGALFGEGLAAAAQPPEVPGRGDVVRAERIVVAFRPGVNGAERAAAARAFGAARAEERAGLDVQILEVPDPAAAVRVAQADDRVLWAEPEVYYRPFSHQGERAETRIDEAWAAAGPARLRGAGVRVAVLDSGVDGTNPDLAGRLSDGGDFTRRYSDWRNPPSGGLAPSDPHGTTVAALAAAADDGRGIVGYAPEAQIVSYKVMAHFGGQLSASSVAVGDAIRKSAYDGVPIANLSLGGPFESRYVTAAVAWAAERGTTVVAAAGNDGSEQPMFPAGAPYVLSVGASGPTSDGWAVTPWSNRGDVDVLAPGADVLSWEKYNSVGHVSGTSFAAPQVAGLLAGLHGEGISHERARALLVAATAPAIERTGVPRSASGTGRLDAWKAWDIGANDRPFSAVFVDHGTSVSRVHGVRHFEVLRYSPIGGDTALPTVTSTSSVVDLRFPVATGPPPKQPSTGTVTRRIGRFALDARSTTGSSWDLRISRNGEPTVRRPSWVTAAGNGPEAIPSQPGTSGRADLRFGARSGYVRQISARAGDTITIDFRYPSGVDPAQAPVLLGVWEPRDGNGDGQVDVSDPATLAQLEPDWYYDGAAGSSGVLRYQAPRTGRYVVSYRLLGGGANGTYSLGLSVPTAKARMKAPPIARGGSKASRFAFKVSWEATTRPATVRAYVVQWQQRVKDGNGGWTWSRWRKLGRFTGDGDGGRTSFGKPGDVKLKQGRSYRFRVRAIDVVGNKGPWSTKVRSDLALDDTHRAIRYGGDRWRAPDCPVKPRRCYGGTLHDTTYRAPATYRVKVTRKTKSFALVGSRCRVCASWDVYVDGRYVTSVSTKGKGWRKVLWKSGTLSKKPQRHTLELVARTTSERWRVRVDGIAIRR